MVLLNVSVGQIGYELLGIRYIKFSQTLTCAVHVLIITVLGRNHKDVFLGLLGVKISNLGIDVLYGEKLPTDDKAKNKSRKAADWKDYS